MISDGKILKNLLLSFLPHIFQTSSTSPLYSPTATCISFKTPLSFSSFLFVFTSPYSSMKKANNLHRNPHLFTSFIFVYFIIWFYKVNSYCFFFFNFLIFNFIFCFTVDTISGPYTNIILLVRLLFHLNCGCSTESHRFISSAPNYKLRRT